MGWEDPLVHAHRRLRRRLRRRRVARHQRLLPRWRRGLPHLLHRQARRRGDGRHLGVPRHHRARAPGGAGRTRPRATRRTRPTPGGTATTSTTTRPSSRRPSRRRRPRSAAREARDRARGRPPPRGARAGAGRHGRRSPGGARLVEPAPATLTESPEPPKNPTAACCAPATRWTATTRSRSTSRRWRGSPSSPRRTSSGVFRATFGETPHRYLQRRRVERAMFLLRETDRSVTEICFDVGFASLGTFSRTFTRDRGRAADARIAGEQRTSSGPGVLHEGLDETEQFRRSKGAARRLASLACPTRSLTHRYTCSTRTRRSTSTSASSASR